VIKEFNSLTARDLPAINTALQKKKLETIQTLSEQQWQSAHEGEGGSQPAAGSRWLQERD
jgi:hypothetical protein